MTTIKTLADTGKDMNSKYKETSEAGPRPEPRPVLETSSAGSRMRTSASSRRSWGRSSWRARAGAAYGQFPCNRDDPIPDTPKQSLTAIERNFAVVPTADPLTMFPQIREQLKDPPAFLRDLRLASTSDLITGTN